MKNSIVFKLSVKFAAILTIAFLIILFIFFATLRRSAEKQEYKRFSKNGEMIARTLTSGSPAFIDKKLKDVPFFISYLIYDTKSGEIFRQQNNFAGKLPDTKGKTVHFSTKKGSDGESLNILYLTTNCHMRDGRIFTIQVAQKANNDPGNKFIYEILLFIGIAAIPVLIISFFLCRLFVKQTIRPVVEITDKAATISSTNLDQRLPETGQKDELDNLAQTFNNLFSRLKSDFDRERSFTSNVSHELKTPVAVILGQANLLRRWGKNDSAQLDKSLNTILQETHSMDSIISNLLQLSKLESGKIVPDCQEVDLTKLFARLSEEFISLNKNLKIIYDEHASTTVFTDAELLHQVFVALISNSNKFIPENPVIELKCIQNQDFTRIEVCDNGPGFEKQILPHIFERFYRGDSSHNRSAGGSGLGLSIAKAIINSLNGEITAENAKNGGALISITLNREPVKKI